MLYKTPEDHPIPSTASLSENVEYLKSSCFYTDDLITRNLNYENKPRTKDANRVLTKMQKANSDTLGIGRKLIAYHPDLWKKTDWEKDYPNIDLSAKVTVNIVDH
ncbi:Ger(x)C family spore germination C-terminal domain-containing protein [Fictibacillus enclensis]|uniref:Ger(x)C family spore germination C-terminal domain-containing protein n=1 Tax=Fictibacillus enclensis TaxID=1017270 RepID=UPI0025A1F395|nr:Ger(x)C family spore germination C-terminal domain-containing protein [Fictibacillus enclensis]MDM5198552.1 Ger(x)C family spore germination C-terminal domain-containing protein [Fictibacillus enclensis]